MKQGEKNLKKGLVTNEEKEIVNSGYLIYSNIYGLNYTVPILDKIHFWTKKY